MLECELKTQARHHSVGILWLEMNFIKLAELQYGRLSQIDCLNKSYLTVSRDVQRTARMFAKCILCLVHLEVWAIWVRARIWVKVRMRVRVDAPEA